MQTPYEVPRVAVACSQRDAQDTQLGRRQRPHHRRMVRAAGNKLPTVGGLHYSAEVIAGELKQQVDRVWDAFWSGGISNPLEVIEQITYLIFIRRLDDLQTAKENKANRTHQSVENPIYSDDEQQLRWREFKNSHPDNDPDREPAHQGCRPHRRDSPRSAGHQG